MNSTMYRFDGFPQGRIQTTPIPYSFFDEILPNVNHLGELKLILIVFWLFDQMEGPFRYVLRDDLKNCEFFMAGMGNSVDEQESLLDESLDLAVSHNILLRASIEIDGEEIALYFINSPKGRTAIETIKLGQWQPTEDPRSPLVITPQRLNIYQLYEENIGPLTPIIAETLAEAEDRYPEEWIEDAFRIAVERNKRYWRYIAAILERWRREGR